MACSMARTSASIWIVRPAASSIPDPSRIACPAFCEVASMARVFHGACQSDRAPFGKDGRSPRGLPRRGPPLPSSSCRTYISLFQLCCRAVSPFRAQLGLIFCQPGVRNCNRNLREHPMVVVADLPITRSRSPSTAAARTASVRRSAWRRAESRMIRLKCEAYSHTSAMEITSRDATFSRRSIRFVSASALRARATRSTWPVLASGSLS